MASISQRGLELVARWNSGDRGYVLDQLSEDFVLRARLPKLPLPAKHLTIRSKTAFRLGLWALQGRLPKYVVISALENSRTIFLVLKDPDGHVLAVTIKLDEDGLFSHIGSFRPGHLAVDEHRAVWTVRARNAAGETRSFACGTDVQLARRARNLVERGFDEIEIVGTNGETRQLREFEFAMNAASTTSRGPEWALKPKARRKMPRN
jgi:hypothetical protein